MRHIITQQCALALVQASGYNAKYWRARAARLARDGRPVRFPVEIRNRNQEITTVTIIMEAKKDGTLVYKLEL